jgi:hypothetical protein
MISESLVKEKLSALLRNEISLEDFENWLLPAAWNMFNDSSQAAVSLVSSIHLLLDERDDRVLSEADLRRSFLGLLNNVVYTPVRFAHQVPAQVPARTVQVVKGTSKPIHRTVRYQPQPVTSWVAHWSARPAQLALRHVQV